MTKHNMVFSKADFNRSCGILRSECSGIPSDVISQFEPFPMNMHEMGSLGRPMTKNQVWEWRLWCRQNLYTLLSFLHNLHLCTLPTLPTSALSTHSPHLCTISPPLHNLPISAHSPHLYTLSPPLHSLALLLVFWPLWPSSLKTVNSGQKINTTNHKRKWEREKWRNPNRKKQKIMLTVKKGGMVRKPSERYILVWKVLCAS